MIKKINQLPKPLKIVCWVHLISAAYIGWGIVSSLISGSTNRMHLELLSFVFFTTVILSILLKSEIMRILALCVTYPVLVIHVVTFVLFLWSSWGVMISPILDSSVLIPAAYGLIWFVVFCITIWGLTEKISKDYFENN